MASRWAPWVRFLPCSILIAVASVQLVLAHTQDLTAWHGGGFGMFSTLDVGDARHVHAFVLRPGIEREVWSPPSLEDFERRVCALPSDSRLRALALELGDTPTPDYGPAMGVRIQVWRTRFDSETLAPSSRILRERVVPLDGE